jgi:hypothetical protein
MHGAGNANATDTQAAASLTDIKITSKYLDIFCGLAKFQGTG